MTYHKLLVLIGALVLLYGCKDEETPNPVNNSPCVVASAPSYFGTTQTFEYDETGNLKNRRYEFGYPGYGPFSQTVDSDKTIYSYTSPNGVTLEVTDVYIGGTGNLYDGSPRMMSSQARYSYNDGKPGSTHEADTVLIFDYDDQKRLSVVTYYHELFVTNNVIEEYNRQHYATKLELTYDNNDNVTRLKQSFVFREGVYVVNNPSESYFTYLEDVQTIINVTYDDKLSPFTAVSKYWKFVQGDWGYVTNSNWQAIIIALSKNNPLTISYEFYRGKPSQSTSSIIYNYNEQGFPIDSYTYTCK
jgi:hypothetical protein